MIHEHTSSTENCASRCDADSPESDHAAAFAAVKRDRQLARSPAIKRAPLI